ncbi:ADP-ribosylglycohydrolase family protein [Salipiger sp. 1_MG-2023]|uniref:ADP-ribosylglycohydrolase family protein n=1 Tax=Salipiger sp. 1_MG-2023 TaxID=3062665 RepID=UPI0026E2D89F|nr:ADP-ribosylglycohydrolase family protein [Salipiger sp. 1_MG-2023]MDO6587826.1 ADP-ribosylglycohydrolase family protein [Salipiger sp. 1_MG-2023]
MRAADYTAHLLRETAPRLRDEEEQTWDASDLMRAQDAELMQFWASNAPGSGAPECLMAGALQSLENKGFVVGDYGPLLQQGLDAARAGDMESLLRIDMQLRALMRAARPDPAHRSQATTRFADWDSFAAAVDWPADVAVAQASLPDKISAGWLGQLVGAAAGTALEGYSAAQIADSFGAVTGYLRPPNTYNDDITFELAFLETYLAHGAAMTSGDIASNWVGMIPLGWSAEGVALDNLRRGVMPPMSGKADNPFDEWIGAQMRGAICGMVMPGRAQEAARLAWMDAQISHAGNGILGEVFNAVLCAMAFAPGDLHALIERCVAIIPETTEYGLVVRHALAQCRSAPDWQTAWAVCDERYRDYNWIHAYPNAAAQIIALWFGGDDFDRTLTILCGIGHDVDCNAAQMLCVLGLRHGSGAIDARWSAPLLAGDIITYMRRPKTLSFASLVDRTLEAVSIGRMENAV